MHNPNVSDPANGGADRGGLGAGGDIFVQQSGALIVEGGTLAGGSVTGGTGANPGQAYGTGIFIHADSGTQEITFSLSAGQMLAIADAITDEWGSAATGGHGGLIVTGGGTVKLTATGNNYTGGSTIEADSTLEIGAASTVGSGAVTFSGAGTLRLDGASISTAAVAAITGFTAGDVLYLADIGPAGMTLSTTSLGIATLGGIPITGSFGVLLAVGDGSGGSFIEATTGAFDVAGETDLNQAITTVNGDSAGFYRITFTNSIAGSSSPDTINMAATTSLTIDGAGNTLDGVGGGLFVGSGGGVTFENMTFSNDMASGGGGDIAVQSGGTTIVAGGGTVKLGDSFAGGLTIEGASTLEIAGSSLSGSGTVAFSGFGTLQWDGATFSAGSLASISGFAAADVLHLTSVAASAVTISGTAGSSTVNGIGVTGSFSGLQIVSDGGSGSYVAPIATLDVSSEVELNQVLATVDAAAAVGWGPAATSSCSWAARSSSKAVACPAARSRAAPAPGPGTALASLSRRTTARRKSPSRPVPGRRSLSPMRSPTSGARPARAGMAA